MSLLVGNNAVVSMHYTLTNDDGQTLDTSAGREPMGYLHGAGNIIPGLETALTGKSVGDKFSVSVEPAEAYGEANPELVKTLDKSMFTGIDEVEVGMNFEAQSPDGQTQPIVVTAVEGDNVTVDANHPLAGQTLNFEVEVVDVREATEEEIAHGHAH